MEIDVHRTNFAEIKADVADHLARLPSAIDSFPGESHSQLEPLSDVG